ncbi:unnamed protein product, partial [Adineta steineri]
IGPYYGGYSYAITQPIIYDNGCSCALYPNCTSQASFIEMNSSETIPIRAELINDLFVEEWATNINYSSYYEQCSPLLCSYTYSKQINPLYTITLILGLQGGLTIVLKWICPKIVRTAAKVYHRRKKQTNIVFPVGSLPITTTQTVNINVHSSTSDAEQISNDVTSQDVHGGAAAAANATVAAVRQQLLSYCRGSGAVATVPSCQLQFQPIKIDVGYDSPILRSPTVADFNNDGRLDLAFISESYTAMNLMVGNGDGTLTLQWTFSAGSLAYLWDVTFGDLNGDSILDLIFIDQNANHVGIFFGYGNGTFDTLTTLSTGDKSYPYGITVANFDGDNYLDIAVANLYGNNFGVFFGKGNRTFSAQTTFATGFSSLPIFIVAADFNNDGYIDIAVVNYVDRNIGVFLGHGNGTFDAQQTSFTGGYYYVTGFAIGDFNSDGHLDAAFPYEYSNSDAGVLGMLFGCGNATLNERKIFNMGTALVESHITVGDFNGDGHLDVVVCSGVNLGLNVLVGDGNGNFGLQTMTWNQSSGSSVTLNVGDFNGDSYQDIVYADDSGNL